MAANAPAQSESLTRRSAWKDIENHHKKIQGLHLRTLFADDPKRGERLASEDIGIYLDHITTGRSGRLGAIAMSRLQPRKAVRNNESKESRRFDLEDRLIDI